MMESFAVCVTRGTVNDIDVLMQHRLKLWSEVSTRSADEIKARIFPYREWLSAGIENGCVTPFIAKSEGAVAGSGCVWIREIEPKLGLSRFEEGYLMAMYTEQHFRRQGVASAILQAAIAYLRERGVERMTLHSSESGRPLYEKFGFGDTTEMRLNLK